MLEIYIPDQCFFDVDNGFSPPTVFYFPSFFFPQSLRWWSREQKCFFFRCKHHLQQVLVPLSDLFFRSPTNGWAHIFLGSFTPALGLSPEQIRSKINEPYAILKFFLLPFFTLASSSIFAFCSPPDSSSALSTPTFSGKRSVLSSGLCPRHEI